MAADDFKRKLTAVFSADVVDYSRLMGEDEDATIRTLTTYRELISTLIQKHRGLREHVFSEEDFLNIALTATSRSLFSRMVDAVGAQPPTE